jgi:beta-xylosidase
VARLGWVTVVIAAAIVALGASSAGTAAPGPSLLPIAQPANQPPAEAVDPAAYLPPLTAPQLGAPEQSYPGDFPDPFVVRDGPRWWAYATGGAGTNIRVMPSADLHSWSAVREALPTLPAWADPGFTWAPAVVRRGLVFVLYYTVRVRALARQCISVAVAATAGGPFVDRSRGPLACQPTDAGSIDPSPFVAPDGKAYLLWKGDDNAVGARARIGVQRLSDDGLSLVGPRLRLLTAGGAWQAGVIEGPAMVAAGDHFLLFYGGGHWDTAGAGIGYASCRSPLGPCLDQSAEHPWLTTGNGFAGPSGPAPFAGPDGQLWLAFHGWTAPFVRSLWMAPLALP